MELRSTFFKTKQALVRPYTIIADVKESVGKFPTSVFEESETYWQFFIQFDQYTDLQSQTEIFGVNVCFETSKHHVQTADDNSTFTPKAL